MDKVPCPWCGSEMAESGYGVSKWFRCTRCRSESPHEIGIEEAYAAALRRPLQKPLTLEEACDDENLCVFLEIKDEPDIYVSILHPDFSFDSCGIDLLIEEEGTCYKLSTYGKFWRCWATKPSDEERSASKWE